MGLVAQLAALLLLAHTLHASAATSPSGAPVEVDVAGGPLANALLEIGSRYRVIVSFPPKLVEGLRTAPLRGRYPLEDALAHALRGSDLVADISAGSIVTLKRAAGAAAPPAGAPQREPQAAGPAPAPGPASDEPAVIALRRIVVKARMDRGADGSTGFLATGDSTATLLDTPTSEIPQAVSVVTRDMLVAAQARTQLDALEYAAGVVSFNRAWGFELSAKTRGFPAQLLMMGLPSYTGTLSMDAAVIERVEIAKGPSGVVGGVASAEGRGAVVNFIRKEPYAGQSLQTTLQVNSQDGGTVHLMTDVGGGEGPLLWRWVGYGMHSGRTEAGYAPVHAAGMLGSTRYRAGDVMLTLGVQHEQRRSVFPRELAIRQTGGSQAPVVLKITEESPVVFEDDGRKARVSGADVDVQWRISDRWSLRAKGRQEQIYTDSVVSGYDAEDGFAGVTRSVSRIDGKAWRLSLRADLGSGPVRHKLLLARDMQAFRFAGQAAAATWALPPEQFVPGQTPLPDTPTYGSRELPEPSLSRSSERGILLQHQLLVGSLTTRLALRQARLRDEQIVEAQRSLSGRNWDAGAAYHMAPGMTVYAGGQAAIEASNYAGVAFGSRVATPARSRQQQVGAKFDLLDGGLGFTVEAYRVRQRNVLRFRNDENGNGVPYGMTGLASEGVELELAGRVSAALDLSVGVNAMRTRELRVIPSSEQPFWVPNVASPQRSMHLLASYRLPDSLASGLRASLAMKAQSDSWASMPDPGVDARPLRIPGGAKLDMALTRRIQQWTFGMSVQNVFNRRLCEPTIYLARAALQQPRSVGLTLGYGG